MTPAGEGPPPAAVDLVRVHLPLRRPFVASHGTETVRDLVLVRADDGAGGVGWGECSTLGRPSYTAEHTDGAWAALADDLVPAALRGAPFARAARPMASAALATALLDLALRGEGRSLAASLGATATAVPVAAVVGLDPIGDVITAVRAAVGAGAVLVKCKIAPGDDVARLGAVRAAWPDLALAADANGAYRAVEEVPVAELDDLGLAYLEQPLPPADLAGSAALTARSATPIALDEAIGDEDDLDAALAAGAFSVLNVKPARVGGPTEAARLVARAAADGIDVFVGGMLESGIGRAVALAVAGLPGCSLPTDLGPSGRYFVEDLTPPFVLTDGRLTVPAGPGIGVVPLDDVLDRVTVDRVRLTRP